MADKKSSRKYQYLIFGLCSLLALIICMVVLVITVNTVEGDNSGVAEYETKSKTELTDDTAVLLDYLKALTEKTAENKFIKADVYTDISADDSTLFVYGADGSESQTDKALFVYAKNKMMSSFDGYYPEDFHGVFGTAYSGMPIIDLSASSVSESRFSVGEADESGEPVYNTDTGELIDSDYYFITLTLTQASAESPDIAKLFSLDSKEEIYRKLASDLSAQCEIENCEIAVKELKIYAKINRLTDELSYINFEKIYSISADISFINELEVFGSKHIDFEYKVNEKYEYSYAGIDFSETSLTVEPGSEVALTVGAVIENDSEYTVTFSSSDPTVATVDEMGYVKGITQSEAPVTITVTLEYLGETFTDECTVYVGETDETISG